MCLVKLSRDNYEFIISLETMYGEGIGITYSKQRSQQVLHLEVNPSNLSLAGDNVVCSSKKLAWNLLPIPLWESILALKCSADVTRSPRQRS